MLRQIIHRRVVHPFIHKSSYKFFSTSKKQPININSTKITSEPHPSIIDALRHHREYLLRVIGGFILIGGSGTYIFSDKIKEYFGKRTSEVATQTLNETEFKIQTNMFVENLLQDEKIKDKLIILTLDVLQSPPVIKQTKEIVYSIIEDKYTQDKVTELLINVGSYKEFNDKLTEVMSESAINALQTQQVHDKSKDFLENILEDKNIQQKSGKHIRNAVKNMLWGSK